MTFAVLLVALTSTAPDGTVHGGRVERIEVFAPAPTRAAQQRPSEIPTDVIEDLKLGSTYHAFGAALVIVGVGSVLSGSLLTGIEAASDTSLLPGVITLSVGAAVTLLGALIFELGNDHFDEHVSRRSDESVLRQLRSGYDGGGAVRRF